MEANDTISDPTAALQAIIEKHWGYRSFRPLQREAMLAMLDCRDSLVVLPTGGGKSLCYQAPAIVRCQAGGGATVVVSPLIALMKDQVDSLRANGIAAAQIDSSLSSDEKEGIVNDLRRGELTMLFCSPERLVMPAFQDLLRSVNVRSFAIDEAHCISHWGHDFRPEYRMMGQLKEWFPGASVHGFTATATPPVRDDICQQLKLESPEVLVGNFDRPNLTYRVLARRSETQQVVDVISRHKNEAGIIYCIRRKDVDGLTLALKALGIKARGYHAGMTPEDRQKNQEAFKKEKCDLIVATVAFGMGIDRSNIRYVLHTGMPKSLEAYQQETGRAGRDGLEAECVLLYSGADAMTWKSIIEKSAAEAKERDGWDEATARAFVGNATKHINDMDSYARGAACRHRLLVEYFGQTFEPENCAACDHCLGDTEPLADAKIVAQKILSCVARTGQRFGIGHVISVVRGENTERIRSLGHDKLPTYGLLRGHDARELRDWVYQLISQRALAQEGLEYPIVKLTQAGVEVMKGQREVRLNQPVQREKAKSSAAEAVSWEGVDHALFEALRALRKELAEAKGIPPYLVFGDATLRELARVRPSSLARMRYIYGVGEVKLRDFGQAFLDLIDGHCQSGGVSRDVAGAPPARVAEPRKAVHMNAQKVQAFTLFKQGASIEEVAQQIGRARSTVSEYLCDFIREQRPEHVGPWVPQHIYKKVAVAVQTTGTSSLKPIYLELKEEVDYEAIKIVVAHMG